MSFADLFIIVANSTLFFTVPLLITALGGMFAEKSGVVNISLEGTMVFGSFFSVLFINFMQNTFPDFDPSIMLLIAALIAAITGSLLSTLLAFSAVNLKANQVIGGTAINLFAAPMVIFIARTLNNVKNIPFDQTFNIQKVPLLGDIPIIGDVLFQDINILSFVGYVIALVAIFVIYRTRFGLRLSAVGEHPGAADSVGINVYQTRWVGTLISGALAGIGGLVFVVSSSVTFSGQVSGYGFLALAVMIFGQWKPEKILFASLFFGFMNALSIKYTLIPVFDGLSLGYFFTVLPYLATLGALILTSKKSRAPKAEGIPYDKGSR
ncbi:MAG: ABC transporter permease [Firmicutes bacterium]|nr:ABC transporter permease [Bacillota bacterium]